MNFVLFVKSLLWKTLLLPLYLRNGRMTHVISFSFFCMGSICKVYAFCANKTQRPQDNTLFSYSRKYSVSKSFERKEYSEQHYSFHVWCYDSDFICLHKERSEGKKVHKQTILSR